MQILAIGLVGMVALPLLFRILIDITKFEEAQIAVLAVDVAHQTLQTAEEHRLAHHP